MSPISPISPRFSPINMEPYTQTFDMINQTDDKVIFNLKIKKKSFFFLYIYIFQSDNANDGFDQNDGADFFDTTPTSSSTYTHYPATVRKTKRRLF